MRGREEEGREGRRVERKKEEREGGREGVPDDLVVFASSIF